MKQKILLTTLTLVAFFYVLKCNAEGLPEWHQNDYDVKFERAEIVWYNQSYARDVQLNFPFVNRTQRVANFSGYLQVDLNSTDAVGELQVLKFMSNEYRFFPITMSINVCAEFANNAFNLQERAKKMSNFHGCPLKKGFYYLNNYWPEFSKYPPLIPRGKFKSVVKGYYMKQFVCEGHAYYEVKDKPLEWQKFPSLYDDKKHKQ